ncbi:hypothetical protein SO694_00099029 [Aureococcus anophagefferens]|uniref:DUF1772 domain-containing protein n=1 Tax=Aureococcus anophagefferens TaxID=44056 RepID=A0ABR1FSM2_AURAN
MVSSLTMQMQVVLISTVAIGALANRFDEEPSLGAFLRRNFELEYVATRLNFYVGLTSFLVALGVRAWISIACPVVARAALLVSFSGALLGLAFVDDNTHPQNDIAVHQLPWRYAQLLARKAASSPAYAAAAAASLLSMGYVAWAIPHVAAYARATFR